MVLHKKQNKRANGLAQLGKHGLWGNLSIIQNEQHDSHAICSALLIQIQLTERFTALMSVTTRAFDAIVLI